MIPVTPETKTALHQAVKQVRAQITWATSADTTETITSEDKLVSMKKEAEGYYCKSTLRKITIVLTGTDTNLLDRRITATVQVKTGTNTWGNIPWGSFIITEVNVDEEKGTTTAVGYGGIAMLQNTEYVAGELTFPTTVGGLIRQISQKFALEIETDMTTLPNYDAPITEDLWAKISGTTYRDILEEIAGATGTIAVIGRGNDALDFDLPPILQAAETLTEANLITAKIGEKWGKVSAVVLSRQPQGDNIEVVDQATADLPAGKNLFNGSATPIAINLSGRGTYEPTGTGLTFTATRSAEGENSYRYVVFKIGNTADYVGKRLTLSTTIAATGGASPRAYIGTAAADGTSRSAKQSLSTSGSVNWKITNDPNRPILVAAAYLDAANPSTMQEGATVAYTNLMVEITNDGEPTTYEPFKPNGRVDLVIANNEILDPQRETTAQPILDAVKGWEYRNAEIKTEGHGYHEIGDRLDISIAGNTYQTVVTKSAITVDGGIKETLTSATPEIIPINYAKSGGITKTIFRTELEVDKQEQRIDSIVSRQDATDAAVQEQFTQVTQNLTNIVATVQATGGGNLIRNSVGYGKASDGTLTIWQYGTGATTSTIRSQSSPASLNAGAVSGYEIMITGATISQPVDLTPGEKYTLALRAQKGATGSATITIGNSSESKTITLEASTAYTWQRQSVDFTPTMGANTVTITAASGTTIELTDLILTTGGAITWRQASSEIYNTQVSLDQAGVQVRSSVYTGDYVEITPLEFSGWSNASGTMKKVFTLNRETTEVEQLEARSQIKMPPIKIVPINNSSYKGWAFVKED